MDRLRTITNSRLVEGEKLDNLPIDTNAALGEKVDIVPGMDLSENDYTTTDKNKVANLPANTNAELTNKVDKVSGKELSENDYIDGDKDKVHNLPGNTTDELAGKVDKISGKGLSDENYSIAEKNKVANMPDDVTGLIANKVDKITGKGLSKNDYTDIDKNKVANMPDDVTGLIANKVDKESGKGLSERNFTESEKNKLAGLESSKYKGTFPNVGSLSGIISPTAGDYADVDEGVGKDIERYVRDVSDSAWVKISKAPALTAAEVKSLYESNPDTNPFDDTADNKLQGIEAGSQKNVKSDWNAISGDAQVLNKPPIPEKTSDISNDSGFVTIDDSNKGADKTYSSNKIEDLVDNIPEGPQGQSQYLYVAYATDAIGTGASYVPSGTKKFISLQVTASPSQPALNTFTYWTKFIGDDSSGGMYHEAITPTANAWNNITHSFGTQYVLIQVYKDSTKEYVGCERKIIDNNTIAIKPTNADKIIINILSLGAIFSGGLGDMEKANYDTDNGNKQVAFKDEVLVQLGGKVDTVVGKGLSDENYSSTEKSKVGNIPANTNTALSNKVDKISGKGLSQEDFTTVQKNKLDNITAGATANDTDVNLKNRTNHTGVQAISTITNLQSSLNAKEDSSNKNEVNGYAGLDATAKIPTTLLPSAVLGSLNYQGSWNASTNAPTIADGTGEKGWYRVVTTAGTKNLGSGNIDFDAGDWVVHNGSKYERLNDGDVTSVNGQTGVVVLTKADVGLSAVPNKDFTAEVNLNTAKVGITPTQASNINTNNAKISFDPISSSRLANTSGTNTGDQTTITGNAGTATKLATARAINGVNFDGTAPITVTAAATTLTGTTLKSTVVSSSLTSVGTIATGVWNATAIADGKIASSGTWNAKQAALVSGTNIKTVGGTTLLGSGDIDGGTGNIGYKNIPSNSQSANYPLVLGDAGKSIDHPSSDANARTFTIPSNASVAYPVGTTISFSNMTAEDVTIAITTDTMYLAGDGTTGSRTLAQYGVATIRKLTATTRLISGVGLT